LQLASTLGEWHAIEAGGILAQLAVKDVNDPFISAAIVSSALPHLKVLARLNGSPLNALSDPLFATALGENRRDILLDLLRPVFAEKQFARYSAFLDLLGRSDSLVEDLIKASPDDALSELLRQQESLIASAMSTVADETKSSELRFDGAELMAHDLGYRHAALTILAGYVNPAQTLDRQRKAIAVIANTGATNVPALLTANWSTSSPEIKSACIQALFRREPWTFDFVQQIESGGIPVSDLNIARRNRLLKHESKRVRDLAQKIFSQTSSPNRAKAIEQFRAAIHLSGDIAHGKEVFGKLCSTCHQLDGIGNQVGPDLKSVAEHPAEKILVNILDPNADIQPGYNAYNCALTNGEELFGLISAETATSVIFKFADGASRTINRREINGLRSSNLSLMPEGLEQGLSNQDVADLIAYLKSH
jgi:putative heme-binding domain-containing protein